jgi:RNA polymerase-binding transcription factor DksA
MDIHTQTHLTTIRNLLSYRQHELRTEVHAEELARRGDAVNGLSDRKDDAVRLSQGDVAELQERRDLDELAAVERALARLDQGCYGDCLQCGEAIALERLLAQPAAECCVACQSATERGQQ